MLTDPTEPLVLSLSKGERRLFQEAAGGDAAPAMGRRRQLLCGRRRVVGLCRARAGKGSARGRGEPSKDCTTCVGEPEEAASLRRGVWVTRRTFSVGTPGSGPHSHQSQAVAKTRGGLDGRPVVVGVEVVWDEARHVVRRGTYCIADPGTGMSAWMVLPSMWMPPSDSNL